MGRGRGRPPIGATAMTSAERQRRFLERLRGTGTDAKTTPAPPPTEPQIASELPASYQERYAAEIAALRTENAALKAENAALRKATPKRAAEGLYVPPQHGGEAERRSMEHPAQKLKVLWKSGRDKYQTFFIVLNEVRQEIGDEALPNWCYDELRIGLPVITRVAGILKKTDEAIVKRTFAATRDAARKRRQ